MWAGGWGEALEGRGDGGACVLGAVSVVGRMSCWRRTDRQTDGQTGRQAEADVLFSRPDADQDWHRRPKLAIDRGTSYVAGCFFRRDGRLP